MPAANAPAPWTDGASYDRFMGRWSAQAAPRFLEWAAPDLMGHTLEVGCGTGVLTQALAERGAARVTALDLSPQYLDAAKARLASAGPRFEFRQGDAAVLPFPDSSFDAVVSALMIHLVPDATACARQMARVAKPGARVATYVWGVGRDLEFVYRFWKAAMDLDPAAREAAVASHPLVVRDAQPLLDVFRSAGLDRVEATSIRVTTRFADFSDYWDPFTLAQGPPGVYLAGRSPEERESLRARLEASVPRADDGSIDLSATAWAVRGVKA